MDYSESVWITVRLHELDFVSLLRAARLLGTSRENVIKQAIANYLIQLQKQGLDLGIQLPPEPKSGEGNESASSEIQRAGDGSGHTN